MIRKILFAAAWLLAVGAAAQEKWSLRRCIDYAIDHNIAIQQQALSVESAEIELNTARNSRLPGLSASTTQSYGQSISPATGGYESRENATTNLDASASITLYAGRRIAHQTESGKLNLNAALENLAKAKENLGLTVTSYYLDALFQKEVLKVAEEQAKLTEEQVEKTRILVKEGKVPESQLYDIQAQSAQNQVAVTNARNSRALSLLNLAQALNLPDNAGFDVQEPDAGQLMIRNALGNFSPEDIYDIAIGVKPQVREAEYRLESSRSGVKVAQSARQPNLSLGLNYGTGYSYRFYDLYNYNVTPPQIIPQVGFSDQINENRRVSVRMSLSVPIFNRFQTRNQIRSAQLNVRSRELELDNVKQALYKEIQQAWQSAAAAQARYRSTEQAYEAACVAYEAAQTRYEVGRSTVYEFGEAQMRLFSSRSEQLQAQYDYVFRAKILDFYRGEPIDIR